MSVVARLTQHLRRHGELYWVPLLYCAAVLGVYFDIWHSPDGRPTGFGWDTIESYGPSLAYFAAQLGDGEWPLWNPYVRGGYSFASDPQASLYYGPNLVIAGIAAMVGYSWWTIQIKVLAHHVIAGCMMHLYLRSRGLTRLAAVIGGLALIGSTPMLLHKASNILWPMAWIPLLWLTIDRVVERPSWRRGCAVAAVLVLCGSAGSPPGFFYSLLLAGLYGLFRLVPAAIGRYRSDGAGAAIRYGRAEALALLLAIGVCLAMLLITILPSLEITASSVRAGQRGVAYALLSPLPVKESLIGMLVFPVGAGGVYCGLLVLMLGLCAVLLQPGRDRLAPVFFLAAAGLMLILAFGSATPALPWLAEHVPGFELFRIANRYKLPMVFAVAALAGFGANALVTTARGWTRERWVVVAVAAVVTGTVIWLALTLPPVVKADWMPPNHRSIALAVAAAALVLGAALHKRRAAAVVLAMMSIVVLFEPRHYVHARANATEVRQDHESDFAILDHLDGVDSRWRLYDEYVLGQLVGSRRLVRDFRGYPSLDPLAGARYSDVVRYAGKHPEILEAYNVRYVLHGPHHRNGKNKHFIKRSPSSTTARHFQPLAKSVENAPTSIHEALHPVPLVAWYGAVHVVTDPKKVLDAVRATELPDGARRTAIVETPSLESLAQGAARALPSVAGELLRYSADEIEVRIDAPAPGLVVLNEIAYPGWVARVDGEIATIHTANYLLRAVEVDAGSHVIELSYSPPRYGLYFALWLIGLGVLLAALATWLRSRRAIVERSSSKV